MSNRPNFSSPINTVLFDYGNTLVEYFNKREFSSILDISINNVKSILKTNGLLCQKDLEIEKLMNLENYELSNNKFRPLDKRLSNIFKLDLLSLPNSFIQYLIEGFSSPIVSLGKIYNDTIPTLQTLKMKGYNIGIVSNAPWGMPSYIWLNEINRHNINEYVDFYCFCSQVGWRKPSQEIFQYTLSKLKINVENCIFVGDDLYDDIFGAKLIGIQPYLLDRNGSNKANHDICAITNLYELEKILN